MSYLEGHRQRLRDRFNESGLGAFEDHEVLELLLAYAVPRKDVKPIAHALLDRFGSLSNVLDAPTAELTKVNRSGNLGGPLV
jgi:DNA repair protein RadC